jgi:hypothetical protein
MPQYLALALALVFMTGPALAADTTVSPLPIYQFIEPIFAPVLGAVALVLMTQLINILNTRTTLLKSAQAQAAMEALKSEVVAAVTNGAGRIFAGQEGNVAAMKFDTKSPEVAAEVTKVMRYAGTEAATLGITPEHVADMITAKIGILQASGSALPAPVAAVPATLSITNPARL